MVGWKPYYYNEVTQTFHSFFHPTAQDSGDNIPTLAGDLATKINTIRNALHSDQVDVVAHSMGGLVARAWISGMESVPYNNEIRRIITAGTPHFGIPYSSFDIFLADNHHNDYDVN